MAENPDQHTPEGSTSDGLPNGGEPSLSPDDTQPRAPVSVPPSVQATASHTWVVPEEPPIDPLADTADRLAWQPGPGRTVLLAVVLVGSACLCLLMIGFAGIAGYRDGLATNDANVTQTLATGIAEQYALGMGDLNNGFPQLAEMRFAWIVETLRPPTEYARDSAAQLAVARTMVAYTPTPSPTVTLEPSPTVLPTATPTLVPSEMPLPTLSPLEDPEYLFEQAKLASMFTDYEEAIELLKALLALNPPDTAMRMEATAMLQDVLINQARIYLTGQNEDGQDRLQRGVLLMNEAQEIGPIEPDQQVWIGQANFVQSYILARDYVNGGFYETALQILIPLCEQNCQWSYPNVNGISVADLKARAENGIQGQ